MLLFPRSQSIGPGDGCEYFTAPSDRIALEWTALIRDWSKVRKQELKDGGPSIIKAGPNRYSTEQWKERRASTSAVPDSVKKSRRRSSLIQRIFSRMSHAELEVSAAAPAHASTTPTHPPIHDCFFPPAGGFHEETKGENRRVCGGTNKEGFHVFAFCRGGPFCPVSVAAVLRLAVLPPSGNPVLMPCVSLSLVAVALAIS